MVCWVVKPFIFYELVWIHALVKSEKDGDIYVHIE